MSRMIIVSLPVSDLKASKAFYTALGFVSNPQFTDDTAALMVWSESINVMLLTHAKWRTFTTRPIPPKTSSEVALTVSCAAQRFGSAGGAARRPNRPNDEENASKPKTTMTPINFRPAPLEPFVIRRFVYG